MLTTTLAIVALAGALNPAPNVQTNYGKALAVATAEQKPMAVFVGLGTEKLNQMFKDGTISAAATQLLRDKYVCVTVDPKTGAGKDLAEQVKLTEGLVISDSTGGVRALRHGGTVAGEELTRQLEQLGSNQAVVVATSTAAPTVMAAPAMLAPTYSTYAAPMVISGCANGSCGLTSTYTMPTTTGPVTTYGTNGTYGSFPMQSYGTPVYGSSCANGRCPLPR